MNCSQPRQFAIGLTFSDAIAESVDEHVGLLDHRTGAEERVVVEQVQQPGGVVLTIVTSQTLEEICRKVPADGLGKPVEIGLWSGAAKCRRDVGAALVEHAFDDGPGVVYIHATIVIFVVGVGGDA